MSKRLWTLLSRAPAFFFVLALTGSVFVSGAVAANLADAQKLYDEGAFLEAAEAAGQVGNAASHALAARALIAYATSSLVLAEREPYFIRARREAESAIAKDATLLDGHLQRLSALGGLARLNGGWQASTSGVSSQVRHEIDTALALQPKSPWSLAAYGAFNLEVTRRAGPGLAAVLFNASREKGVTAFEEALAADASNLSVRYEYALALSSFDVRRYGAKAKDLIGQLLALSPRNAHDRIVQSRARILRDALALPDKSEQEDIIKGLRGEADLPSAARASLTDWPR